MTYLEAKQAIKDGCMITRQEWIDKKADVFLVANRQGAIVPIDGVQNPKVAELLQFYGKTEAEIKGGVTVVTIDAEKAYFEAWVPMEKEYWADDYVCVDISNEPLNVDSLPEPQRSRVIAQTEEMLTNGEAYICECKQDPCVCKDKGNNHTAESTSTPEASSSTSEKPKKNGKGKGVQ